MSVSIKELKEILINVVGEDFVNEGFSFNKSDFSFKKRINKSNIQCTFLFYNYAPARVEYNFFFTFLIKEIEDELKRFFLHWGVQYNKGRGMYINEGDFHPFVKEKNSKYRAAFTHIITDFEKDNESIKETRSILRNEFFPRLETFSDIKKFQIFIMDDYNRAIWYGVTLYAALAMKLIGKSEFLQSVMKLVR
jgi:hypothetical protein